MASDPEDFGSAENHPNKRVKTLTLGSPESSPFSSDKGKSKLETTEWEESKCCGICLSESGHGTTIIRGCIDCCEHYFCFVCIMEWSKVESKCPMCKRRFSSIRRPPKPPVFPCERVVNVPVRDQVYHRHGNVTTGPSNLYADVQCNVCQSSTDDSLLLLCDLCDTAYHTYCVGLGATVPEGDWFCTDCSLLRAEQAQSDVKIECSTEISSSTRVSIYEIVQESPTHSLNASDNSSRRRQNTSQSRSIGLGSAGQNGVAGQATNFNARTLGHCRNVHDRIRTMREHWNGFQSGSLTFSSTRVSNASTAKLKPVRGSFSDEPPPSVSYPSRPMASQASDQNKKDCKRLVEVEKAWKMLDMAKAIERNRDRNRSTIQASKSTVKEKTTNCREAGGSNSSSILLEQHRPTHSQNVGPDSYIKSCALKSESIKIKGASGVDQGFPAARGPSCNEVAPSRECRNLSTQLISIRSASTATTVSHNKEISSSSNCVVGTPLEKSKVKKNGIQSSAEAPCGAKTEIQSLVKLNLKILCRDKKLEVGTFKQVARQATHSILAACGLEHQRPGISSFPECVCVHSKEDREVRRSNLMPNSCRECFFMFVKNVVNTILVDYS